MEEAIAVCDTVAPEHLEVQVADADAVWKRINNYGGMFIGSNSAEVFGDYGAGPNHVLPTSGTARYTGGLSVFTFLVRQALPFQANTRSATPVLLPSPLLLGCRVAVSLAIAVSAVACAFNLSLFLVRPSDPPFFFPSRPIAAHPHVAPLR